MLGGTGSFAILIQYIFSPTGRFANCFFSFFTPTIFVAGLVI